MKRLIQNQPKWLTWANVERATAWLLVIFGIINLITGETTNALIDFLFAMLLTMFRRYDKLADQVAQRRQHERQFVVSLIDPKWVEDFLSNDPKRHYEAEKYIRWKLSGDYMARERRLGRR
jgi:uncharacterized membrane protein